MDDISLTMNIFGFLHKCEFIKNNANIDLDNINEFIQKYEINIQNFELNKEKLISKINIVSYNNKCVVKNAEQFGKYEKHQKLAESINDLEFYKGILNFSSTESPMFKIYCETEKSDTIIHWKVYWM